MAARRWCLDVAGLRVHGTTRRRPPQVFQDEERQALAPWDGEPYEVTHWRTAKVHPDHHVACQYAVYSVPSSLCPPGQRVEIGLGSKLVRIYHRGRLLKLHSRQPRGGRSTDAADYPTELTAYTLRAPEGIKRNAAEQGPAVAEFADRLFDGPLPWARIRQGHKLLRLGERYTPEVWTPPATGLWTSTSSTCAGWNASWCRPWNRMPYPNCRHPSQPVVSPGPAPSSPMLMPKEVSHDPSH